MATKTTQAQGALDPYFDLVRAFPLRPIRTDLENETAIEIIAGLAARAERKELRPSERDYLDVLVSLVEQFEAVHYPMPEVSGPAMVRFLMDQAGLTQAQTAKAAGIAESAFSEMLAGKRKMSARHIRALAKLFRVSADVIIGDCEF